MPLAMMKVGERARVTVVTGGDSVKKHLGSLGFVPGVVVSIVQVMNGGRLSIYRNSRKHQQ